MAFVGSYSGLSGLGEAGRTVSFKPIFPWMPPVVLEVPNLSTSDPKYIDTMIQFLKRVNELEWQGVDSETAMQNYYQGPIFQSEFMRIPEKERAIIAGLMMSKNTSLWEKYFPTAVLSVMGGAFAIGAATAGAAAASAGAGTATGAATTAGTVASTTTATTYIDAGLLAAEAGWSPTATAMNTAFLSGASAAEIMAIPIAETAASLGITAAEVAANPTLYGVSLDVVGGASGYAGMEASVAAIAEGMIPNTAVATSALQSTDVAKKAAERSAGQVAKETGASATTTSGISKTVTGVLGPTGLKAGAAAVSMGGKLVAGVLKKTPDASSVFTPGSAYADVIGDVPYNPQIQEPRGLEDYTTYLLMGGVALLAVALIAGRKE